MIRRGRLPQRFRQRVQEQIEKHDTTSELFKVLMRPYYQDGGHLEDLDLDIVSESELCVLPGAVEKARRLRKVVR